MSKKIVDLILIGIVVFAIVGCARGGGSAGLVTESTHPNNTPTIFSNYRPIEYTYDTIHGDITVTYSSGSYQMITTSQKQTNTKLLTTASTTPQGRHDG